MKTRDPVIGEQEAIISLGGLNLTGTLSVPAEAQGVVLFVHGSGSSRFSSRNRFVARTLNEAGMVTLLFDLLSVEEERVDQVTAELRFAIPLLTGRVLDVTGWLREHDDTRELPLGYFGASTGAAAALAAAARTDDVAAIVCRGGRPDLALPYLPRVEVPVLLIVGGRDSVVVDMNKEAFAALPGLKEMVIVPGAGHLFEEPGKLEEVARLATSWFDRHLRKETT